MGVRRVWQNGLKLVLLYNDTTCSWLMLSFFVVVDYMIQFLPTTARSMAGCEFGNATKLAHRSPLNTLSHLIVTSKNVTSCLGPHVHNFSMVTVYNLWYASLFSV